LIILQPGITLADYPYRHFAELSEDESFTRSEQANEFAVSEL
jgi:hypothetical protein